MRTPERARPSILWGACLLLAGCAAGLPPAVPSVVPAVVAAGPFADPVASEATAAPSAVAGSASMDPAPAPSVLPPFTGITPGMTMADVFAGFAQHRAAKKVRLNEGVLLGTPAAEKLAPGSGAALAVLVLGEKLPARFDHTASTAGTRFGTDVGTEKYLYTIDRDGLHLARESTPFPTNRGTIVHTNLCAEAFVGGEAYFKGPAIVKINGYSGRFGSSSGALMSRTIALWEAFGFQVIQ